MFSADISIKLLLITFDQYCEAIANEQLSEFCDLDIVNSMEELEVKEYSHSAVVYATQGVSATHLQNITYIRNKFKNIPVYVLSASLSIPLLLHTTHLHISDVFMLPLSGADKANLSEGLMNESSVTCFNYSTKVSDSQLEASLMVDKTMGSILGIIEKNFCKGPTLNGLSDDFHLSPSRLCHMFKDLCGITFSQYLLCRKLEESERVLNEGNESVTTIAYQLGFSNPSHFSRCFKEHFNVTPSSYLSGNRDVVNSPLYQRYLRLRVDILPATHSRIESEGVRKVVNREL